MFTFNRPVNVVNKLVDKKIPGINVLEKNGTIECTDSEVEISVFID